MKELIVISGKGGTGKTSITAALAALAARSATCVIADCDVDAADLHLLLSPQKNNTMDFNSGLLAAIDNTLCTACGKCQQLCNFEAITPTAPYQIRTSSCEGCGVCARFCPPQAITLTSRRCGEWYHSTSPYGPMVHAALDIGAENSGKLVSTVRQQARIVAEESAAELLLVDGPPGIGCPVIASITGADAVLIVSEPTLSGLHDLKRVIELINHFNLPAYLCINKWDINPHMAQQLKHYAAEHHIACLGLIPYDQKMVNAQLEAKPIVDLSLCTVSALALPPLWQILAEQLNINLENPKPKEANYENCHSHRQRCTDTPLRTL